MVQKSTAPQLSNPEQATPRFTRRLHDMGDFHLIFQQPGNIISEQCSVIELTYMTVRKSVDVWKLRPENRHRVTMLMTVRELHQWTGT